MELIVDVLSNIQSGYVTITLKSMKELWMKFQITNKHQLDNHARLGEIPY